MSNSYIVEAWNLPTVIKTFCDEGAFKHNPLEIISLEQAVEVFKKASEPYRNGDTYDMTEAQFLKSLDAIAANVVDKLLGAMVATGQLDMGHDGNDFCFMKKKA